MFLRVTVVYQNYRETLDTVWIILDWVSYRGTVVIFQIITKTCTIFQVTVN